MQCGKEWQYQVVLCIKHVLSKTESVFSVHQIYIHWISTHFSSTVSVPYI